MRLILKPKKGISTGGEEIFGSKEFSRAPLLSSCYPKAMFIEGETISLSIDRNPCQGLAPPHNTHSRLSVQLERDL